MAACSAALRCATEGATPSSRSAVSAAPAATGMLFRRRGGRCAAPETSQGKPMAAAMARTAAPSSSPRTITVVSVSGCGSTLMVTSVIAPSVPQEPAMSLQRS